MNISLILSATPGAVAIPVTVSKETIDFLRYIWVLPVIIGFITFILTNWYNSRKDNKEYRLEHRSFITYTFSTYKNPFKLRDNDLNKILIVKNSSTNALTKTTDDRVVYLRLENTTKNSVFYVNIFCDINGKKNTYFLQAWNSDITLLIPLKKNEQNEQQNEQNEESKQVYFNFQITYSTIAEEKFINKISQEVSENGQKKINVAVYLIKYKIIRKKVFSNLIKGNPSEKISTITRLHVPKKIDDTDNG